MLTLLRYLEMTNLRYFPSISFVCFGCVSLIACIFWLIFFTMCFFGDTYFLLFFCLWKLHAQYFVLCSRAQTKLDLCMQDFKQNCSMADTLSLDTAVSAGNFLCSTGKQGETQRNNVTCSGHSFKGCVCSLWLNLHTLLHH